MNKAEQNTPLHFGINFSKKFNTVIDTLPTDLMSAFLKDLNIDFTFLPVKKNDNPNLPPIIATDQPLLNYIMTQHGRDKDKKILLIVNYDTFQTLLTQKSSFDIRKLVQLRKIEIVLYSDTEILTMLYAQDQKTLAKINQFKMFVLCDGQPGTRLQSILNNLTFISHLSMNFLTDGTMTRFSALVDKNVEKTKTFLALLLIKKSRPSRKFLIEQLKETVDTSSGILHTPDYSFHTSHCDDLKESYGTHSLPKSNYSNVIAGKYQRNLFLSTLPSIKLYNQTCFEIVDEGLNLELVKDDPIFISEKTIKPIVMGHPFIQINTKHSLKKLKNLGFKTFGDFIDESYDDCETYQERIQAIVKIVQKLDLSESQKFYHDTREICQHNLNNFLLIQGSDVFRKWKNWKKVFNTILYE